MFQVDPTEVYLHSYLPVSLKHVSLPFLSFPSCLSDSDYKMFPSRHVFAAIAFDPLDVNHKIGKTCENKGRRRCCWCKREETCRTRARTEQWREDAASHQRQRVVKRCFSSPRCTRRDFGDASIAVCCCVIAAFSVAEAVLRADDSGL